MNLTAEQTRAIEDPADDILVVACPGSGKSTTLVERIIRDNPQGGDRVIVSTFTNAAGKALREKLLARRFAPWYCGTDHGLCLRILGQRWPRVTILDDDTSEGLIEQTIRTLRIKTSTKAVREAIAAGENPAKLRPVINQYISAMAANGCFDYDSLLRMGAQHADELPGLWRLYVDEYQDSNLDQERLYNRIPWQSRFRVGDPDQNIYEWRGTTVANILQASQTAKLHRLTGNFRSGRNIIDAATKLIEHNEKRVKGDRMRSRIESLGSVRHCRFFDEREETRFLVRWVKEQTGTVGILTRYNAERRGILQALKAAGLKEQPKRPYVVQLPMLRKFLAAMAQPENPILIGAWMRERSPENAQALIEKGDLDRMPAEPTGWSGWAGLLKTLRFRQDAIEALYKASNLAQSLQPSAMLQALDIFNEDEAPIENAPAVLTFHGSKGLEFDSVWIAAADQTHGAKPATEEERRLFYVAMTRAKQDLVVSSVEERTNAHSRRVEDRVPVPYIAEALD